MTGHVSSVISGALYGGALTTAGIWSPAVAFNQLSLRDNYMLRVFISASACSAGLIYAARRSGYAALPDRKNSSIGRFGGYLGGYDANIIGGLLQGLGMALAGADPGTAVVQLALGVRKAPLVVVGGICGALAYLLVGESLKGESRDDSRTITKHTVQEQMNLDNEVAVLGYEMLLIAILLGLGEHSTSKSPHLAMDPTLGGVMIGVAQAGSIVLSKKTLGISTAYSDVATFIAGCFRGQKASPGIGTIIFAIGLAVGAKLIALLSDIVIDQNTGPSMIAAFLGGFVTLFGARLAGGCTSGHGISGMNTLSISSFITVAGIMAGGILSRQILNLGVKCTS